MVIGQELQPAVSFQCNTMRSSAGQSSQVHLNAIDFNVMFMSLLLFISMSMSLSISMLLSMSLFTFAKTASEVITLGLRRLHATSYAPSSCCSVSASTLSET